MLRRVVSVDHTILVLNLVLLLTIGVLPFSTALMAEYLRANHGQNLAAVIYGGSFLMMWLAFFALQQHPMLAKQHLLHKHLTPAIRRRVLRRNASGLLPYSVATVGGILSPYLTLAICAVVALFYALPATTSDATEEPMPRDTRARRRMPGLLSRRTKRGRAVRFTTAIVLGLLCFSMLQMLTIPRDLWAIPIAAIVACVLMLPRHED